MLSGRMAQETLSALNATMHFIALSTLHLDVFYSRVAFIKCNQGRVRILVT